MVEMMSLFIVAGSPTLLSRSRADPEVRAQDAQVVTEGTGTMIGIQAETHAVVVAAEIEMRERGTEVENARRNIGVVRGREKGGMTQGAEVLLGA